MPLQFFLLLFIIITPALALAEPIPKVGLQGHLGLSLDFTKVEAQNQEVISSYLETPSQTETTHPLIMVNLTHFDEDLKGGFFIRNKEAGFTLGRFQEFGPLLWVATGDLIPPKGPYTEFEDPYLLDQKRVAILSKSQSFETSFILGKEFGAGLGYRVTGKDYSVDNTLQYNALGRSGKGAFTLIRVNLGAIRCFGEQGQFLAAGLADSYDQKAVGAMFQIPLTENLNFTLDLAKKEHLYHAVHPIFDETRSDQETLIMTKAEYTYSGLIYSLFVGSRQSIGNIHFFDQSDSIASVGVGYLF